MSDQFETPALAVWLKRTDAPFLALAIGSLPLLLLETVRHRLAYGDRILLDVVNVVVFVAFAVDLVVELAVVKGRRNYLRHEWSSLLIVVAQGLALAPALTAFGVLRALRFMRAGRAVLVPLRLIAIGSAATKEGRQILRKHAAAFALSTAAMTWITSAVAFTILEDVGESGRLHSFFDGLWWSSATITTVGYGDVSPVTVPGRLVGIVTMVVGISTFAVVTAKVAEFLVRSDRETELNPAGDDATLLSSLEES